MPRAINNTKLQTRIIHGGIQTFFGSILTLFKELKKWKWVMLSPLLLACEKGETVKYDQDLSFVGKVDFNILGNGKWNNSTVLPSSRVELINQIYPQFVVIAPTGNNGFLHGNFDISFPITLSGGDSSDLTFQLLFSRITADGRDISLVISTLASHPDSLHIAATADGAPFQVAVGTVAARNGADSLQQWKNSQVFSDAKLNDFRLAAKRRGDKATFEVYRTLANGLGEELLYSKVFEVNQEGNFYAEWYAQRNTKDINYNAQLVILPLGIIWKDERSYVQTF